MEDLIEELMGLNFSRTEAAVYITLVSQGRANGYKIAKILNLSRSTVYAALDNLNQRGCIYLVPGESSEYEPKDPETLIEQLKRDFVKTADKVREKIKSMDKKPVENRFLNIEGYDKIITKTKELIEDAEAEIYINTEFDLELFKKEILDADARGVRTIVFSFTELDTKGLPVEVYSHGNSYEKCGDERLMLVVDNKKSLISSNEQRSDYIGIFTENRLLTRIVSEHIHHDVYMLRLKNRGKGEIVDKDILLNTIVERESDV
ncbi:MAG: HTH domain-containing protein [Clostridia bacterium]|nr:HTH domain-containing protein [Clostridia bacterium]